MHALGIAMIQVDGIILIQNGPWIASIHTLKGTTSPCQGLP